MAYITEQLSFLRSIPPDELQRSQREHLAALETSVLLMEHFGPGKKPHAVSLKKTREIALRLVEANFTTIDLPPAYHDNEGIPIDTRDAVISFGERMRALVSSGQMDRVTRGPGLRTALQMNDLFFCEDAKNPQYLEDTLKDSSAMFGRLHELYEKDAQAEVAAALRAAWPGTTLTLEDVMACSFYLSGRTQLLQGDYSYRTAELNIKSAAEWGRGLAWRVLEGGVYELLLRGHCVTSESIARELLENCKAQERDPLRLAWLCALVVEAGAHAGDWDPWEAQKLLEEAQNAWEESKVDKWDNWCFIRLHVALYELKLLVEAGIGVATATGHRRLGPLRIWLNTDSLKIKSAETARRVVSCDVCGASGGTRLCKGCHVQRYCGLGCQRKDWASHKTGCCQVQAIVADLKKKMEGGYCFSSD